MDQPAFAEISQFIDIGKLNSVSLHIFRRKSESAPAAVPPSLPPCLMIPSGKKTWLNMILKLLDKNILNQGDRLLYYQLKFDF